MGAGGPSDRRRKGAKRHMASQTFPAADDRTIEALETALDGLEQVIRLMRVDDACRPPLMTVRRVFLLRLQRHPLDVARDQ